MAKYCKDCGVAIRQRDNYCRPCLAERHAKRDVLRVEFNRLRNKVVRRDGNKCTKCGSTIKLEVHHIDGLAESHDNRMENLITLCHPCHMELHGKKSKFAKDVQASMDDQLQDRRDIPVFIHRELDDLGLSPNAFRLYCHLARRAGSGMAWPSYQSMGDHCFMGQAEAGRRRNIAIEAMKELVERALIKKVARKDGEINQTNLYYLTPRDEWGGSTPSVLVREAYQGSTPSVPKGTPSKSSDPTKEGATPKFVLTEEEWGAVFKC